MSLAFTINYDAAASFNYNTSFVEFVANKARLKLIDKTGENFTQDFSSTTGFTYDASKIRFSTGRFQKEDKAPSNFISWATYTSSINLNIGGANLIGTPTGGAGITANRLDLAQNDLRYVDYVGTGNCNFTQKGAIKFKLTPNYSGSPASTQYIFHLSKSLSDDSNAIIFTHTNTGQLSAVIKDSSAASIATIFFGIWSPTAGTTYVIELDVNITDGETELFIDGVQLGAANTSTGTRDNSQAFLRVGSGRVTAATSNFFLEDLIFFNAVQNTGNHSSAYTLEETRYLESTLVFPQFSYTEIGSIQAFTDFQTTAQNNPTFRINGLYYNGGWVSSNGTISQTSDSATILSNIASLPASDTVDITLYFAGSNIQQNIENLILEYTGQNYTTNEQTITLIQKIAMDGLESFTPTVTTPSNTQVNYILVVNDIPKYWNGSSWVTSNNTLAQSNDLATIQAQLTSFSTLIEEGAMVTVTALLKTDDGQVTPDITSIILSYNFFEFPNADLNECIVYCYIREITQDESAWTNYSAKLIIKNTQPFYHDDKVILPFEKSADFNDAGYAELSVMETISILEKLDFEIQWIDSNLNKKVIFVSKEIPNQTSINIVDLTTISKFSVSG